MDEKTTQPQVTVDRREAFTAERRPATSGPDLVIRIRDESPRGTRWTRKPAQAIRAFGSGGNRRG